MSLAFIYPLTVFIRVVNCGYMIKLKRAYEEWSQSDGFRVLVDRLWPRGVSKEKAHLDLWLKEVAPSSELRTWFGHDPEKWPEFQKRYTKELQQKKDLLGQLKNLEKEHQTLTIVYSAKDTEHNDAVVLFELLGK